MPLDERGIWINDATGVPDVMMPQGMGDPTGAIVPAPQQTPMAPQQINPRPIPGATPQLGGPPPIPPMLLNPGDPTGANIQPEAVSPELTPGMVNQEWSKLNRPPEWDAGRIASTIASLPVTLPIQLIEGVRGLFGGETIQGWAEQADARYSDPNYSESRAFGVKGVAKEPDYGDRWTGIITGKSQEGARHGQLMRQEIGRYTKQRTAQLKNFKYVGDIYQQSQQLWKTGKELEFLPEEQEMKRAADRRAQERLALDRASSTATTHLANLRAGKMTEDARIEAQLADALVRDPLLVNDYGRLMKVAEGRIDLVNKAIGTETARRNMPNEQGLTGKDIFDTKLGLGKDIARNYVEDEQTRAAREGTLSDADLAQARADTAAANALAEKRRIEGDTAREALLGRTRQAIDEAFGEKGSRRLAAPGSSMWKSQATEDQELADFLGSLGAEKARLNDFLNTGRLSPQAAEAIANRDQAAIDRMLKSGELTNDAYQAAISGANAPPPAPTPSPLATPAPLPTRVPTPPGEMPAAKGQAMLEGLLSDITGPRKTPMATPMPQTTTRYVDLNKAQPEATRQVDAQRAAQLKEAFLLNWVQHEGWKAPRSGSKWDSKWSAFARINGL
jgi:hypothetical protein